MESIKKQNELINRFSKNMEEAIANSLECFRVTTLCLEHCLLLGGKYAEPDHIMLLKECAEICQVSTSFMVENSDFTHDVCGICARICDLCGDSCYDLAEHDPIITACMSACKNCAESCRNMEH